MRTTEHRQEAILLWVHFISHTQASINAGIALHICRVWECYITSLHH